MTSSFAELPLPEREYGTSLPKREHASLLPEREHASLLPEREHASLLPEREHASMTVRTVRSDGSRANIKVTGELDVSTAAPLWAVLQGHVAAGRRFLRLDLSGVTFLDATALTGIAKAHQQLLASRGTLVITGVRSLVARVLHMTGLDETLFVGGTRADDDVTLLDVEDAGVGSR